MNSASAFQSKTPRAAFTLIELLVVIGIIAVLTGIALPTITSMTESGNSVKCVSNLKQIGAALNLYLNDNNNNFPPITNGTTNRDWDTDAINPYLPERTAGTSGRQSVLFICPSARYAGDINSDLSRTYSSTDCMAGPASSNYSWKTANNRSSLRSFTGSLLLFDACQSSTNRYCSVGTTWPLVSNAQDLKAKSTTSTYIDYRHRNAFHGLFADGHVDTISRAAAPTAITINNWRANDQ